MRRETSAERGKVVWDILVSTVYIYFYVFWQFIFITSSVAKFCNYHFEQHWYFHIVKCQSVTIYTILCVVYRILPKLSEFITSYFWLWCHAVYCSTCSKTKQKKKKQKKKNKKTSNKITPEMSFIYLNREINSTVTSIDKAFIISEHPPFFFLLRHLSHSCDLLLSVFVRRRPSSIVRRP
jgi:hypothetical protein